MATLASAQLAEPPAAAEWVRARVEAAVAEAVECAGPTGACLLPSGTVVDRVALEGGLLEVDLTTPGQLGGWGLGDTDLEVLSALLEGPLAGVPGFGGSLVRVRVGAGQPYGMLDQILNPAALVLPAQGAEPSEVPAPLGEPLRAGPTQQGARQPTGALSGVTVFASAGHGWTAGDANWYLQRPVLLDMNEDHGNVDQLNYFLHYAYNAGATVVPFRPAGWQPVEVVLDNDDPGVTYTGSWSNGSSSKYYENGVTNSGIVYKWTSAAASETATARFTPVLPASDFYPVYCFTIAGSNRTLQTYRVRHSGGLSAITVDHRLVGNGWIWLGDYYCEAGGENWVEITNESTATGAIIADAVRWGGGVGDIVRPGPGTVSGYNRDEEAQRYWAESELGNHAFGFDSNIWDIAGSADGDDNVRVGAKWGREMNVEPADVLVDRWKRVHLEFHTNATNGAARGQLCLVTTLNPTTYQQQYAAILAQEIDNDLVLVQSEFEHSWFVRNGDVYTSAYGAISGDANGNEFDATIVELAFHDNQLDAELLRDDRVRAAMARACVHGIIRFLNTLPGSQVPLAFAPDTPRNFAVQDGGNGDVVLTWQAPLSDGARGDPATGYVIYQSSNGYGFGEPIVVGNLLAHTITGVPTGETRYYRIAATNSGGESMPSETLAVRRPAAGLSTVLIVNGFDRLRRQINPTQTFTQPPAYAGLTIERQIWRRSNAFDYVVAHAEALAAAGYGFSSCANEAITGLQVVLDNYAQTVWILGTESAEDATFSSGEQVKVQNYLNNGGGLFVTGADLGYDLVGAGHGASFLQDTLKTGYASNAANTFQAAGAVGSILADIGTFGFDEASGAPYKVASADVLTAQSGALACLNYVGGTGGVAGVQYTGPVYNAVTFGVPFEAIGAAPTRAAVMQRVLEFLESAAGPVPFDWDHDGDVDWTDYIRFIFCFKGTSTIYPPGHTCRAEDGDGDGDVDLLDYAQFQTYYGTGL